MKNFILLVALVLINVSVYGQDKKVSGTDYVITISTEFGDMIVLLYDQTPKHKANFIKLSNDGTFTGTTFHRIIKGFMIQGGDPNSKDDNVNNDGQGGPGYTIPAEILPSLKHVKGALSAARMGDGVNPQKESSGSQFFIVQNAEGTPFLDGGYTVFGQTVKGLEVVDKIADQPKDARDRPLKDIKMTVKAVKMKKKKIIKLYKCERFYK